MVNEKMAHSLIDGHRASIKAIKEILSTFGDLKEEMEEYETKKNVAKTVGTSVAALGAVGTVAGVGLAFFTGGISLALTYGSLAATVGGTGVNLVTDIVDHIESKGFYKRINDLVEEYQWKLKSLDKLWVELHSIVKELKEQFDVDDNTAWYVALNLSKEVPRVGGVVTGAVNATRMFQAASLLKTLQTMGTVTKTATGGLKFVFSTTSLTAQQTKALANVVGSDIVKFAPSAGKAALQGALALVSVVVTIWEIKTLVDDWKGTHPTIQAADKVMNELRKTKESLENFVRDLENIALLG